MRLFPDQALTRRLGKRGFGGNAANAADRVATSLQRHPRAKITAQTMGVNIIAVAPCSRGRNRPLFIFMQEFQIRYREALKVFSAWLEVSRAKLRGRVWP